MTRPNCTEIVFVIDRSGSMSSIANDMRGGFASFVEEQRGVVGVCLVTMVRFDHEYELVYEARPIAEVPPLDLLPRGSTALLDAVGRTIVSVGERFHRMREEDRPSKVLFVIITDGQENASQEYRRARVAQMIQRQRDVYRWDFVFLGCTENTIAAAADLGIEAQNAVRFSNLKGAPAQAVMKGLSPQVASYRTGRGLGDLQASYDSASQGGDLSMQAGDVLVRRSDGVAEVVKGNKT